MKLSKRCDFSVGDKVNYCNGLILTIFKINYQTQICWDEKGMWYALANCKPIRMENK